MGAIEFAVHFIDEGQFETAPEEIHRKAFHLLRLLVANHPFVDANKRTALNTVVVFFVLNGYRFEYDDEIRSILKQLATDVEEVDEDCVVDYLRANTGQIDLDGEIAEWREDLIQFGIDRVTDDSSDQNK